MKKDGVYYIQLSIGIIAAALGLLVYFKYERGKGKGYDYEKNISIRWSNFVPLKGHPERGLYEVFFIHKTNDCDLCLDEMRKWYGIINNENIAAVNVIEGTKSMEAKRYLTVYPTPFPAILDSTNWFDRTFHLNNTSEGRTPVVIIKKNKKYIIIHPLYEAKNMFDKEKLVSQINK